MTNRMHLRVVKDDERHPMADHPSMIPMAGPVNPDLLLAKAIIESLSQTLLMVVKAASPHLDMETLEIVRETAARTTEGMRRLKGEA